MSDMLERAAKALWEVGMENAAPWPPNDFDRNGMREEARAALLAALDPTDVKAVPAIATAILAITSERNSEIAGLNDDGKRYDEFDVMVAYDSARAAITALKTLAQGERPVSEDQGRKDNA